MHIHMQTHGGVGTHPHTHTDTHTSRFSSKLTRLVQTQKHTQWTCLWQELKSLKQGLGLSAEKEKIEHAMFARNHF